MRNNSDKAQQNLDKVTEFAKDLTTLMKKHNVSLAREDGEPILIISEEVDEEIGVFESVDQEALWGIEICSDPADDYICAIDPEGQVFDRFADYKRKYSKP